MRDRSPGETFPACPVRVPSTRQVPQRSPLRYPGGKSRLIPHVRLWLSSLRRTAGKPPDHLVEPFAGGGIISLTAAAEKLARHILMGDTDAEIATMWQTCLTRGDVLAKAIGAYRLDLEPPARDDPNPIRRALGTLIRNRTKYNGNLTTRAGQSTPENQRWYGKTIADRVQAIHAMRRRITFQQADWTETSAQHRHDSHAALFIDPPYSRKGKRPLYSHRVVDQKRLFAFLSDARNDFLMTCENCGETTELVRTHRFSAVTVNLRNGANGESRELLITRRPVFT